MGKFIKFVFYAVGTFLLLFSSIIVGVNFYKDSGVFDKKVVEVKKQPVNSTPASKTPGKIVVDSKPVEGSAKDSAETTKKSGKTRVQVVNCTGKNGLAGEVKTMLVAQGFEATAETGNIQSTSQIIVRKKGIKTGAISNMLKISKVSEEIQAEPYFDITIILGNDYNP
ncbi:LytR C-terminal domain-containing protein [Ruminiclostridium josui]|uniref:LytR C-terminal domain-containing protein n=1 Tax=Ruminiclostridium josui TaxID=1499 RepID=UPI0004643FC9|nr:LytR C-terminal domain-containing protein [Ruminiclostridium josui]